MRKKRLAIFLAMAMVLLLGACGEQPAPVPQPDPTPEPGITQPEPTPEPAPADGGKVLVVYYSATGSTKTVAGYIAEALGADIFELTPVEPYAAADLNWNDADSRVCREHADESLREVALTAATVENWEEYDTVFIGYPIWWGIAAWPVDGFVTGNDFTGKTVIPFCTSASSPLGQSGELLAKLAGTGDWQEGHRFGSSAAQSEVAAWAEGLGISD